jgi:hypothetical protein
MVVKQSGPKKKSVYRVKYMWWALGHRVCRQCPGREVEGVTTANVWLPLLTN